MASTGRNTTFILLIMLSIVVFLFLNMVLGSVRIPMSAVWHIFTGTGDEPQTCIRNQLRSQYGSCFRRTFFR